MSLFRSLDKKISAHWLLTMIADLSKYHNIAVPFLTKNYCLLILRWNTSKVLFLIRLLLSSSWFNALRLQIYMPINEKIRERERERWIKTYKKRKLSHEIKLLRNKALFPSPCIIASHTHFWRQRNANNHHLHDKKSIQIDKNTNKLRFFH